MTTQQHHAHADPPWALRIGSWAWAAAGFVLALGPVLAALLVWLQYRSLRKNAYRLTDLVEVLTPDDVVNLAPYVAEFERVEAVLAGSAGWVVMLTLGLYLLAAAAIIAAYLVTTKYTLLGSRTARIFGTSLSLISGIAVFFVWQTFAAVAWLPIDALWANHLGLVVIALHIVGVVLVWLPGSNNYFRTLASKRIAAQSDVAR